MARKTKAVRLQETTQLLEEYTSSAEKISFFSWEVRFLRDIVSKLSRDRVLSTKQRARVDQMIAEGVRDMPTLDAAQERKFDVVTKWFPAPHQYGTVAADFKSRLLRGYSLSPKQTSWFEKMVEEAEAHENGTAWRPDADDIKMMKLIIQCADTYSGTHWYNHSAGKRAIEDVKRFIEGTVTTISQQRFESAQHAVRGTIKKMLNPKFVIGQPCYIRTGGYIDGKWETNNEFGLVVDGPKVSSNNITYDLLVNGQIKKVPEGQIYKRRMK